MRGLVRVDARRLSRDEVVAKADAVVKGEYLRRRELMIEHGLDPDKED